ncbi:MAG: M50 family metallopeptidase [Anaeromyxobacter sp.]
MLSDPSPALLRFRLLGFTVGVRPLFVLLALAAGYGRRSPERAVEWLLVLTVSILWHELGHALAMRRFGHPGARIELHVMGGLTHWPGDAAPTPWENLWVSAAGPLAGLLLGAATWQVAEVLGPLPPLGRTFVADLLWVNVGWSLFNLLPLMPLDGSHVVMALHGLRPRLVPASAPGWASALSGAAVVTFALRSGSLWMAMFGGFGLVQGVEWIRRHRRAGSVERAREAARRAVEQGKPGRAIEALFPFATTGRLGEPDLALLVRALVDAGRLEALAALAQDRLAGFDRRDDGEPLARLALEALVEAGQPRLALEVAKSGFQALRVGWFAYEAAALLVELGEPAEAVAALRSALEAGLDARATLATDPALAALRGRPDFEALAAGGA